MVKSYTKIDGIGMISLAKGENPVKNKIIVLFGIFALVLLITSACGSKDGTASKSVSGASIKFENFVRTDTALSGDCIGYFNLNEYLEAYGAQDIWRLETHFEDEIETRSFAKFKNGITVEFSFRKGDDTEEEYDFLSNMIVCMTSPDYRYDDIEKQDHPGIGSEWYRRFENTGAKEFTGDKRYEEKHSKTGCLVVNPDEYFYLNYEKDNEKNRMPVTVPEYFDAAFRADVLPYLNLKDPSFRDDPLKNTNIGGKLKY